jgi:hypothetical protein
VSPRGHRADLDAKLGEYVLSYSHREGRHKARVFQAVLGITAANQEILANGLRTAIENSDEVEFQGNHGHGDVYVLRVLLTKERGAATVLSAWIIRREEDFPRW